MHHGPRGSAIARVVAAIGLVLSALSLVGVAAPSPAEALSRWSGGIDLYRTGVFTTQKTWLWCTAADVQIIRNIVDRRTDHTRASQARYFDAMRAHNRYDIPVSDGVDPAGWTYGLRHFVDSRYRLVTSRSFDTALRSAVASLRRTNLPVGITVARGNHAWVLTGFTATADPAATGRFTVTSVRVVGPLWGLQSRSWGYDMRPDTKLTPRQLAGFFTPWHYAGVRMAWEGEWVSIQPSGRSIATAPAPTPSPTPKATPTRAARSAAPSSSSSSSPSPSAGPSTLPLTGLVPGAPSPEHAAVGATLQPGPAGAPDIRRSEEPIRIALIALVAVAIVVIGTGLRAVLRARASR